MKLIKGSGGTPKLSYTGRDDRHFVPTGLYIVRTMNGRSPSPARATGPDFLVEVDSSQLATSAEDVGNTTPPDQASSGPWLGQEEKKS